MRQKHWFSLKRNSLFLAFYFLVGLNPGFSNQINMTHSSEFCDYFKNGDIFANYGTLSDINDLFKDGRISVVSDDSISKFRDYLKGMFDAGTIQKKAFLKFEIHKNEKGKIQKCSCYCLPLRGSDGSGKVQVEEHFPKEEEIEQIAYFLFHYFHFPKEVVSEKRASALPMTSVSLKGQHPLPSSILKKSYSSDETIITSEVLTAIRSSFPSRKFGKDSREENFSVFEPLNQTTNNYETTLHTKCAPEPTPSPPPFR